MGDVMKIGGNSSGVVKGFSANDDGAIYTTRKINIVKIFDEEQIRDTDNHRSSVLADLSGGVFVSLRVKNTLGVSCTLRFYRDRYDEPTVNSTYLYDANLNAVTFPVPDNSAEIIVTPDDLPFLPYLSYIHLGVKADTAPESGSISVWAVVKG